LPIDKLIKQIDQFAANNTKDDLKTRSIPAIQGFSEAILTTDLVSKLYQDSQFNVLGMTKGSGMIHPQMATMLAFLVSDVRLKNHSDSQMQEAFRAALKEAVDESFNSISVDGDTSTNDMVLFLSNAQGREITLEEFKASLKEVCRELALKIILDGEGTNRVIQLKLLGISDSLLVRKIAKSIVNSLLVKTAIFGCDPNWGRIISALGQASAEEGSSIDVKNVSLKILGQKVYEAGVPTEFNKSELVKLMQKHKFIEIELRVASGEGSVMVWGSDLSYDYIRINAEYTT
jgi:glutamate N-acetyltransferase/amino-acid N-acetyltransferase